MPLLLSRLIVPIGADATDFTNTLRKTQRQLDRAEVQLAGTAGRLATAFGVGLGGAIGLASVAAVKFESDFAGVRKTLDATEPQFQKIRSSILDLQTEIPFAAGELANLAETAGQLGVAAPDVIEFTTTIAKLGAASNLAGEQGAQMLARFANITGAPADQYANIASAIVDLGNNAATTEAEIGEMALRLAGAGAAADINRGKILGIAAGLADVGVRAEAGGSAFSKFINRLASAVATGSAEVQDFAKVAGVSVEEFSRLFREDAADALVLFLAGLGKAKEAGQDLAPILDDLSIKEVRLRDAVTRTALSHEKFAASVRRGGEAIKSTAALDEEFARRLETTESQLKLLRGELSRTATLLGEEFVPVIRDVVADLQPVLESTTSWIRENPELTASLVKATAAVAGLSLVLGPLLKNYEGLVKFSKDAATVLKAVGAAALTAKAGLVGAAVGVGAINVAINQLVGVEFIKWLVNTRLGLDAWDLAKVTDDVEKLEGAVKDQTESLKDWTKEIADAVREQVDLEKAIDQTLMTFPKMNDELDESVHTFPEFTDEAQDAGDAVVDLAGKTDDFTESLEALRRSVDDSLAAMRPARDFAMDLAREMSSLSQATQDAGLSARGAALDAELLAISQERVGQRARAAKLEQLGLNQEWTEAKRRSEAAAEAIRTQRESLDSLIGSLEAATANMDIMLAVGGNVEDKLGKDIPASASQTQSSIQEVSTVINDLGRDIASSIAQWDNWGRILQSFKESMIRVVIQGALEPLIEKLKDLTAKIIPKAIDALGKLFGFGGGGSTSTVDFPHIGGGGGGGGGIPGIGGGGIQSLVSLGLQVFDLFQGARRETTLNAIELNTRTTAIAIGGSAVTGSGGLGVRDTLFVIAERLEFVQPSLDHIGVLVSKILGTLEQGIPVASEVAQGVRDAAPSVGHEVARRSGLPGRARGGRGVPAFSGPVNIPSPTALPSAPDEALIPASILHGFSGFGQSPRAAAGSSVEPVVSELAQRWEETRRFAEELARGQQLRQLGEGLKGELLLSMIQHQQSSVEELVAIKGKLQAILDQRRELTLVMDGEVLGRAALDFATDQIRLVPR